MDELDIARSAAKNEADYADEQRERALKAEARITSLTRALEYLVMLHNGAQRDAEHAEAERDHWKANHADIVNRAALLSQRDDLPVDRLPAYREMERLQKEVGAKQAEIDRLMLEFCPNEMTPEQIEEWGRRQRMVPGSKPVSKSK